MSHRDRRLTFTPRPDRQPDAETLAWIATIEAIRQAEAPACCPTCGSTATVTHERLCRTCGQTKRLSAFPRHRGKPLGRAYTCRPCHVKANQSLQDRAKLSQFRALLSAVAS